MRIPQRSFAHSVALFTSATPWTSIAATPDVNAIHTVVKASHIAYPAAKANLVEAASHHERQQARLVDASVESFNILAVDGHVERRVARNAHRPVGFVGTPTGFEQPPAKADEYAAGGIPFVSTFHGYLGTDW